MNVSSTAQLNDLKSNFLALYRMVVADGIVDVQELEALYRIGREQYGLTEGEINHAIVSDGTSFVVPESFNAKIQFLYNLATIALADGQLDDDEVKLMKQYVLRMGFLEQNVDKISDFMFDCARKNMTVDEVIKIIK